MFEHRPQAFGETHRLSAGAALDTKAETWGKGSLGLYPKRDGSEADSLLHVKTQLLLGFSFPR